MSNLFSFQDLDGHYTIRVFGIKFSIRHKCNFNYKPATEYGITPEKRNPQLIVSLTSYPGRINTTHLAVNTLLRQTIKPDRVILWLSDSQFKNKENDLPSELLKLKEFGLEIKWCEDIRSYKKLIPALKEFPDDIIVTADDDIYYEENWLKSLYESYLNDKNLIHVQRAMKLVFKDEKLIYTKISGKNPGYFNQQLGGTGCLYPPHCLNDDVLYNEKLYHLLPTSDDVAFWAMAVLNKTKIKVVNENWSIHTIDRTKETSLSNINQSKNVDNKAILFNEYPNLKKILSEEGFNA